MEMAAKATRIIFEENSHSAPPNKQLMGAKDPERHLNAHHLPCTLCETETEILTVWIKQCLADIIYSTLLNLRNFACAKISQIQLCRVY